MPVYLNCLCLCVFLLLILTIVTIFRINFADKRSFRWIFCHSKSVLGMRKHWIIIIYIDNIDNNFSCGCQLRNSSIRNKRIHINLLYWFIVDASFCRNHAYSKRTTTFHLVGKLILIIRFDSNRTEPIQFDCEYECQHDKKKEHIQIDLKKLIVWNFMLVRKLEYLQWEWNYISLTQVTCNVLSATESDEKQILHLPNRSHSHTHISQFKW